MKKITVDVKKLIVEAHRNGINSTEIGKLYHVNPSSVRTIVQTFLKHKMYELPRGHRAKKLNQLIVDQVKSWLDTNCHLSLKEIQDKISEQFNVNVCVSTIKRCMDHLRFSFKRTSIEPEQRNSIVKPIDLCNAGNNLPESLKTQVYFILSPEVIVHEETVKSVLSTSNDLPLKVIGNVVVEKRTEFWVITFELEMNWRNQIVNKYSSMIQFRRNCVEMMDKLPKRIMELLDHWMENEKFQDMNKLLSMLGYEKFVYVSGIKNYVKNSLWPNKHQLDYGQVSRYMFKLNP